MHLSLRMRLERSAYSYFWPLLLLLLLLLLLPLLLLLLLLLPPELICTCRSKLSC
jgi:hypothetical protein